MTNQAKRSDDMVSALYEGMTRAAAENPHHRFVQIRKGSYRIGYTSMYTEMNVRRCNNADRGEEVQFEIELCKSTEKASRKITSSFNMTIEDAERLANILLGKAVA